MSRVAAVIAAIGLIVCAVLIRQTLDKDDGPSSSDGDRREAAVLVCAEELADACRRLDLDASFDVRVEDAAVTADALSASDGGGVLDVWAVSQPWPAIVDQERARDGLSPLFAGEPIPIASTPLVAVGASDLDGCDWRCLVDRDDRLRFGSRPLSSGVGVLTIGAATASWFGRADFATNDFDPAFDRWLADLIDATKPARSPVTQLLQARAFFDVALSFEAEAASALQAASPDRTEGLSLLHPSPAATLVAVIVTAPRGDASRAQTLAPSLQQALAEDGWSAQAPDATGLPSPGVLTALRDRLSR